MTDTEIRIGDAVDLIAAVPHGSVDLVATDPPYAFGGDGPEHAVTATVAVVLRECALRLKRGGWLIVFAASSWRSQAYMVEAVRGILEPVRVATWAKPEARGKTRTPGWAWQTVKVIAMRKGRSADIAPAPDADWIIEPPMMTGRRAQLPHRVALWALRPRSFRSHACISQTATWVRTAVTTSATSASVARHATDVGSVLRTASACPKTSAEWAAVYGVASLADVAAAEGEREVRAAREVALEIRDRCAGGEG